MYMFVERHRKNIRLKNFDYATTGKYFITICCQHCQRLFGNNTNGKISYFSAGNMVDKWWKKIPIKFPGTEIDEYIIMPDHFHGIVSVGSTPCGRPPTERGHSSETCGRPPTERGPYGQPRMAALESNNHISVLDNHTATMDNHMGLSLQEIVGWFKTMTTNEYIRGVKKYAWPEFAGKIWQRSYFERIIRNEIECNGIREYIINNPAHHI